MRRIRSVVAVGIATALALVGVTAASGQATAVRDLDYDLGSPPPVASDNELDLYLPPGAGPQDPRPVVVYVHGGGWRRGDKANQIADKVALFTAAGYVFASLNYRLSPDDPTILDPSRVKFPDHPDDIGEALGWLDRNLAGYGGDRTRLLLIGHSAGAHLVSLVSTDPSYAAAYGVKRWQLIGTVSLDTAAFDVAGRIAEGDPPTQALYYNAFGTPAENAASGAWAAASPLIHADPGDPRMLLVTQAAIQRRIAENSAMATALGQDPGGVLLEPYDHVGINDAVGSSSDYAGETAAIIDFFARSVAESADPRARIVKHPQRRVESARRRVRVGFRLRVSQANATLECRLDRRDFRPCGPRVRYRVRRGPHRFLPRAVAATGRPGPVTAFRFRVR